MYINFHTVEIVDPHAGLFGRGGLFRGDPHDNKIEEVVQFPRLLRNYLMVAEEFFPQSFTKTFWNH